MARQVLPIVGALVGGYFGGPTGAQLGWAAGAAIGGAVDPVINKGPALGDLPAQTSAEGAHRGVVYGTAPVYGNVLCTGPAIKTTEIITGEKGAPKTEAEVVYRNYAIRICEGPVGGVPRIWQDDKLVYDVRPGSLMLAESAKWISNKAIYLGTEDQLPDIYLQLNVSGVGETPAYRGTSYMVVGLEDLTDRRGSIPQYRFEVAQSLETEGNSNVVSRGGSGLLLSEDGVTWTPDAGDTLIYYLVRTGQRILGWGIGTGHPRYSDDAGVTWTEAAGDEMGGSGGSRFGFADEDTVMIAVGITGILRSADAGLSYTLIPGSPDSNAVFKLGFNWISLYSGTLRTSVDEGNSWSSDTTIDYTQSPFFNVVAVSGNTALAAGKWGSAPRIMRLEGAVIPVVSYETLPSLPGVEYMSVVAVGDDVWIAGADDGTILCLIDDVWEIVDTLGVRVTGAFYNGIVFVVAGAEGTDGIIKTSPDGVTWTTTYSSSSETSVDWGAVVCLEPAFVGGSAILSDIVADLHDRANVETENYNVDELDDVVAGLVLAGDFTAAGAINTLSGPYFFARSEYDGKLWYPKLGKPVVETLTIDDLVEIPDLSKREQAIEYPKKLHLFYQNAITGYAVVKATSSRSSSDARVIGETSVQVPVVLNADQAAQTAHKMHKVAWADADGEVKLTLPFSFVRLVVADNIGLPLRGQVRRLRIDEIEDDLLGGVRNLTLRHDRQSAYTSHVTGIPIPEPTLPPSTIVGDTAFAFLDISSRLDTEDDLNYYVAGTGAMEGWFGWALQRSLDSGANYSTVEQFTRAAVMGVLLEDVAAASEHYTDTTNTVRVQLYRDGQTIEDITEVQFLSEGGAFALEKADGSWEIMQYRDVSTDSSGIPTLSTLHRGRLNSGASAHTAGAKFVMLDRVEHITALSAWLGQSLTHRAVSLDQSPELAAEQTDTYIGRSQTEWPVASLSLSRDGSDVITATWAPRHRFGTDDAPVASINFQGYRVTLDDGVLPAVTFDQTAASFAYDASALGSPLTVSVSALNRITGAGPATSDTV